MISEAPTSNLDPATSHGATESSPPAGVSEKARITPTDPDKPPPKDRSLYDWYVWQFARSVSEPQRLVGLLLLAEREYMERTVFEARRIGLRKGELTDNDIKDGGSAEREMARRVIEWYEGRSALEVAVLEYASEAWVRKVRRLAGRNPEDGRKRPEFLDLDDDERRKVAERLHARELRLTTAAHRLGVDKNTLKRYWPAERQAVTA